MARRTTHTAVRVTNEELEVLRSAALIRGISISDFLRQTALFEATKILRDSEQGSVTSNLKRTKGGFSFS